MVVLGIRMTFLFLATNLSQGRGDLVRNVIFFLFAGALLPGCEAQGQRLSPEAKEAVRTLRVYDEEAYDICKAYQKADTRFELGEVSIELEPPVDLGTYVRAGGEGALMQSLSTLVHEACHGYTHHEVFTHLQKAKQALSLGEMYSLFYLDKQEEVLVKHTPTFPSSELHEHFPDSLKSARYQTYVYPPSGNTTQTIGIYGLLDEWHAYYHGTKMAVRLYPYFHRLARDDPEQWAYYFTGVHGTYLAYPEFKLYLLAYLLHAQRHQPEVYEGILANHPFKRVVVRIDSLFGKLIEDYQAQKTQTLQDLMMAGMNCGEDEEFVFLGNMGYGNFRQQFDRLQAVLARDPYKRMWERLTK